MKGFELPNISNGVGVILAVLLVSILISGVLSLDQAGEEDQEEFSCEDCNIVLISTEPVRADHISYYGYDRHTTPFIDSMAENSLVFRNTFSQSSHTLTSLFSTLTSMYPSSHGVTPTNADQRGFSNNFTMFAEVLEERGYNSYGLTGDKLVTEEYGFGRGYENYTSAPNSFRYKEDVFDGFLRKAEEDEKFFLFYQSYAAHDPYIPPKRYSGIFGNRVPEFREDTIRKKKLLSERDNVSASRRYQLLKDYYFGRIEENETLARHAVAEYDSTVRHMDSVVKKIVTKLEERGLKNETVIVVTSQHGEMLGEHGEWRHHRHLYTESIKVPLIVRLPSKAHRDVSSPVEMIDLAPTLLDLTGGRTEGFFDQGHGKSLVPLLEGNEKKDRFVFSEGLNHDMRTLIDTRENLRYFWDEVKDTELVFNLSRDYSDSERVRDEEVVRKMGEVYDNFYSGLGSVKDNDSIEDPTRPYFGS